MKKETATLLKKITTKKKFAFFWIKIYPKYSLKIEWKDYENEKTLAKKLKMSGFIEPDDLVRRLESVKIKNDRKRTASISSDNFYYSKITEFEGQLERNPSNDQIYYNLWVSVKPKQTTLRVKTAIQAFLKLPESSVEVNPLDEELETPKIDAKLRVHLPCPYGSFEIRPAGWEVLSVLEKNPTVLKSLIEESNYFLHKILKRANL